jgi:hypothetical protein
LEAVDLLTQEKQLRSAPVGLVPPIEYPTVPTRRPLKWMRPLALGLGSAAVLVILWGAVFLAGEAVWPTPSKTHRFVIYRPDVSRAEITGSFTGWQPRAMNRIGDSGYWEMELSLPGGEHRFAYILEGDRRMADPTVQAREKDDFGGENSVLSVSL